MITIPMWSYCTPTEPTRRWPFGSSWTRPIRITPRVRVVYTLDEEDPAPEGIRSGRIMRQLVEECVPDFAQRTMFCYGPGGMVKAMQRLCQELGLPEAQIQAEVFGGY